MEKDKMFGSSSKKVINDEFQSKPEGIMSRRNSDVKICADRFAVSYARINGIVKLNITLN